MDLWRAAITAAKTVKALKAVGEDLARSQDQSDFLGGDAKLNEAQLASLRAYYAERLRKIEKETLPGRPAGKPEFNK